MRRFERARGLRVQRGAAPRRDRLVGDVADQRVAELVLRSGRETGAADQLAFLEPVQRVLELALGFEPDRIAPCRA
jgi:hypothetical protein